jgi:ribosome biogenesis ATPase
MLRPGRLDKLLYVPLPTADERLAILKTQASILTTMRACDLCAFLFQARRTPLADDVELAALARDPRTARFSGADLAGLVREAAVAALREHIFGSTAPLEGAEVPMAVPVDTRAPVVAQRHFLDALGRCFPSVSAVDERQYTLMYAKLRHSRAHLEASNAPSTPTS